MGWGSMGRGGIDLVVGTIMEGIGQEGRETVPEGVELVPGSGTPR